MATNIFRKIRKKDSTALPPDGQITRLRRSTCPPVTWLADAAALSRAWLNAAQWKSAFPDVEGLSKPWRINIVLWHSRSMSKCRSRFGDQNFCESAAGG
jgi:hypothetical protein